MSKKTATEEAIALFREQGGIEPRTLYTLRDAGTLEQLARGLYRLADLPPLVFVKRKGTHLTVEK